MNNQGTLISKLYYKNLLILVGPELIITPLALKYASTYYGCFLILLALVVSFITVLLTYKLNLKAQFDSIYEIAWRFGGNSFKTITKFVQVFHSLVQISIYITLISALLEFLLNHARGTKEGTLWTSNEILKIGTHIVIFILSIGSSSPIVAKISVQSRLLTIIAYVLLLVSSIAHFIHFRLLDNYEEIRKSLYNPNYTFGDGFSIFPYFICIFATHNNLPLVSPSIDAPTKVKFSALFSSLLTIGIYAILYGSFVYNTLFSQTHAIPFLFYPDTFYDKYYLLFSLDILVACIFICSFILSVPSSFTFINDMIDDHFFSEWQPSLLRRSVICLIFTSLAGLFSALFWMDDIQIALNGSISGVIMIYFIPGIVSFVYGGRIKYVSLVVVLLGIIWFAIGLVYVVLSLILGISDTISTAKMKN